MYLIVLRPHSQAINSSLEATSPSFRTPSSTARNFESTSSARAGTFTISGFNSTKALDTSSIKKTLSKGRPRVSSSAHTQLSRER